MKKYISLILLGFLTLLLTEYAFGADSDRKLTIMVYMCGSNLETLNGAASNDIQEMQSAGISKDISLLIMTGGSKNWSMGFDSSETIIYEVSSRGSRIVKRFDKKNMGSRKTLTDLLVFGKENRPADNYALILWDHGGGPLEGVCWDELFSMDNLNLNEITEGIRLAELDEKLSWIGFDACLMGSLEVAAALAPYADFMIASQETEPVTGWNYSFLKGIESDRNGAETGRRIIDAYFDGQEESRDILTLSCIDLSKAAEAGSAMDRFFIPLSASLSEENFSWLSQVRTVSVGFGKGYKGYGDEGYDLVDAIDMVSRLDIEGNSGLGRLLAEAVVYAHSNEEGANGLSLYHPYMNKNKYLEKWRDSYSRMSMSSGYTSYIKAFGTILTGGELVDWSGLQTVYEGSDEENHDRFSLQLDPEQIENFSSAKLYILRWIANEYSDAVRCYPVFTDKAFLNSDGLLTGTFSGKFLYVETEKGWAGPIGFRQTNDGANDFVLVNFRDNGDMLGTWSKNDYVLFFLDAAELDEYEDIVHTRVYDDATETFTNRLSFSEDGYYTMRITNNVKYFPAELQNSVLPSLDEWESVSDLVYHVPLPSDWHFGFRDLQTGDDIFYAMFEITDSQQNTYCSRPIPVANPYQKEIHVVRDKFEAEEFQIQMSGQIISAPRQHVVNIRLEITNISQREITASGDSFIFNGTRIANSSTLHHRLAPGEKYTGSFIVDSGDLIYMDELDSLSFSLKITDSDFKTSNYSIQFDFENCEISGLHGKDKPGSDILAEAVKDGISVKLLDLTQTDAGFNMTMFVENNSERLFEAVKKPLVNGIHDQYSASSSYPIQPGMSAVLKFTNLNQVSGALLPSEMLSGKHVRLSEHVQQSHGFQEISEIDVLYTNGMVDNGSRKIPLQLKTPFPIEWEPTKHPGDSLWNPAENGSDIPDRPVLVENNLFTIRIEQIFMIGDIMIPVIEITNKAWFPIEISAAPAIIKGPDLQCKSRGSGGFDFETDLAPGATGIKYLLLDFSGNLQEPSEIKGVSVAFRESSQPFADPAEVIFKQAVLSGASEAIWKNAEDIDVIPGSMPDIDIPDISEKPHPFESEIIMPENAAASKIWLEAPLSEYRKGQLSSGTMSLVMKDYGKVFGADVLQTVATQKTVVREDGSVGALFSGLIPYIENAPDTYLYAVYDTLSGSRQQIRIDNVIGVTDDSWDPKMMIRNMKLFLDFDENKAQIYDFQKEGTDFGYQHLMKTASVDYFLVASGSDSLRLFKDLGHLQIPIHGNPIRLGMRPVSPDENLYVLFNFVRKGGSSYSLPLIPYSEFFVSDTDH